MEELEQQVTACLTSIDEGLATIDDALEGFTGLADLGDFVRVFTAVVQRLSSSVSDISALQTQLTSSSIAGGGIRRRITGHSNATCHSVTDASKCSSSDIIEEEPDDASSDAPSSELVVAKASTVTTPSGSSLESRVVAALSHGVSAPQLTKLSGVSSTCVKQLDPTSSSLQPRTLAQPSLDGFTQAFSKLSTPGPVPLPSIDTSPLASPRQASCGTTGTSGASSKKSATSGSSRTLPTIPSMFASSSSSQSATSLPTSATTTQGIGGTQ